MAAPTRAEALATLAEGQRALDALLAKLSDDELTRPATIGGGDWSARDLLGHVAFWEELAIEALAAARAGRRPRAVAIWLEKTIDVENGRDAAATAAQPLAATRERASTTHAALLEALGTIGDDEWRAQTAFDDPRPGRTTADLLGGILGAHERPFGHAFAHLPDLEAYVGSLGRG